MKTRVKVTLLAAAAITALLLAAIGCDGASVSGTVTYRERIALSPGAKLVVEIRDVSYADAAAPLIASQTISDPGQVPIEFEVAYDSDDIDSRNVYSVSARIIESDGRLAFTNDTAHEVITRGNPKKVDMVLVLVEPPPGTVDAGADWRTWVETPVQVISANLIPDEREHFVRVFYYQSTIEGCARPGSQGLELDGNDIRVRVTLMQPPPTPWAIPCDEERVELDAVEQVRADLEPGQTYRVIVNDHVTATFTLPAPGLGHTIIAESPIETAELVASDEAPAGYSLRVVSRLPKGSSCSPFNGYEIMRGEANGIDVVVTHREVVEEAVPCTADLPVVETFVPLGGGLEPGVEYTVSVNSERVGSFVAR